MEWDLQKANKSYIDEIEKYRKEVLHEGLQVEEEGLVGIHRKKLAGASSSRQNGTLGILKEGQERARNRIIPKPKNKTVPATIAEEKTDATPILLTTTLKPVAFTGTTRRLTAEEETTTTTTTTPASPAATDSTKPTQKAKHEKKSENRSRRPHRQRKNKNRRRKNRRRKKQKQE